MKDLIYKLDSQLKEQEQWRVDIQNLENIKIQNERRIIDLENDCINKENTITSDKRYIEDLERKLQDANIAIDQTQADIRNQDDHITNRNR